MSGTDPYYRGFPAQDGKSRSGLSPRVLALLITVIVLVGVAAVLNLLSVDKVIYKPGPVYNTLGEIDDHPTILVDGADTYPTTGELNFTTVQLYGGPGNSVSLWEWLMAEVNPDQETVDEELVFPPEMTSDEVQEQNAELMANSQNSAAVVALRELGVEVPEQVTVAQVMVDAPAEDTLQVNDVVRSVGGTSIESPSQVRDTLQEYDPGEEVEFDLVRDGEEITVPVPTGEDEVTLEDGTTETMTVIGVYLASDFELPYDVTIDAGNVGGPSAGLMFSLAVYDVLTEEDLTGGENFAGTGTIDSTGAVGPISGIRQKMVGADDAGADYFLAPADNCDEVRGHVPDGLDVIRVETFEDGKDAVEALGAGGDPADLPQC